MRHKTLPGRPITEATKARVRLLTRVATLNHAQVVELLALTGIGDAPPTHDGVDASGGFFWLTANLMEWAAKPERTRVRRWPDDDRRTRSATIAARSDGSQTWDPETRQFEAVAATETPAEVFDPRLGEFVREILVAEGGQFPDRVPLLDSHNRETALAVKGSMSNFRRARTDWMATGQLAADEIELGLKIEDGSIDSLSVGYRILESQIVYPGESAIAYGRTFYNDSDDKLMLTTRWKVHEVSIVSIGADPNARIRTSPEDLPMPIAIHSHNSVTRLPRGDDMIAAACLRAGVDPVRYAARFDLNDGTFHRLPPSSALVRAADHGRQLARDCSFVELLAKACGLQFANARRQPHVVLDALYRGAADPPSARARGFSTSGVESLLTGTFATLMAAATDAQGDTTEGWCSVAENLNLRRVDRLTLGGATLTRRAVNAEAQHLFFIATGEATQLGCYAGYFEVDEQDVLDDATEELLSVAAQQLAAAAAALRPNLVYATLARNDDMADGTALFHANHGNLKTSAALADDKLGDAMTALAVQQRDGVPLNLRGEYLIVPQALERKAAKLVRDVELADPRSTRPPVVVSDSRLDNGLADPTTDQPIAGSATTWYLASSRHGVEVQYLAGRNRMPQLRGGFIRGVGKFGYAFDVEHFLGVKAIDHRGIVKNTA